MVADAVAEGLMARSRGTEATTAGAVTADEPLAEWERELLAGSEAPAEQAAPEAAAAEAPAAEATEAAATEVTEAATEAPAETN
ncbi:MAG: hypothetical protein U0Q19_12860 [Kineosporiaceae bacterium]